MHTRTLFLRRSIALILAAGLPFIISSCSESNPGPGGSAGAPGAGGVLGTGGGAGSGVAGDLAGAPGTAGSQQAGAPSSGSGGGGAAGTSGGVSGASAGSSGNGGTSAESGARAIAGAPSGGSGGAPTAGTAGSTAGGTAGGAGAGTGGNGGSGAFALTSPNHTEGALFANKYTCAEKGFNGSVLPELHWTAGPPETKSYAITFIDVTLTTRTPPDNNGYHWVVYNIRPDVLTLPEAFSNPASVGGMQNRAYLGPCPNVGNPPPTGSKTDTYEFTIYALETDNLTVSGTGTAAVRDAETKLEAMHLAKTKLTGTSNAAGMF